MKFILILFFCVSAVFGRICFQSTKDYKKSFGECASTDYCFTADLISQRSGEQVVRGCGSGDILTHGYGVQSCDEFGVSGAQSVNNNGISGRLKCCKSDYCNSATANSAFGVTISLIFLHIFYCFF
uniref:Activin types I and II receptor domain-containing protein n=1 Tax=Panagrolaimus sp. PS1159 TaxID=55785 RepID=A0AC35FSU7_9BILA